MKNFSIDSFFHYIQIEECYFDGKYLYVKDFDPNIISHGYEIKPIDNLIIPENIQILEDVLLINYSRSYNVNPGNSFQCVIPDYAIINTATFKNIVVNNFFNQPSLINDMRIALFKHTNVPVNIIENGLTMFKNLTFLNKMGTIAAYYNRASSPSKINTFLLKFMRDVVREYYSSVEYTQTTDKQIIIFHPKEKSQTTKGTGREIVNVDELKTYLMENKFNVEVITHAFWKNKTLFDQIHAFESCKYFISPFGSNHVISLFLKPIHIFCLLPGKYLPTDFWYNILKRYEVELGHTIHFIECTPVSWWDTPPAHAATAAIDAPTKNGQIFSLLAISNLKVDPKLIHTILQN